MDDAQLTLAIVRVLAQAWQFHQSPAFADYAKQTFGCLPQESVKCDGIYIGEAEAGDATVGAIGGLIKQWWLVDDRGITPVPFAQLPRNRDEPENLRSQFYLTPVIKFLTQGDAIAIGEAYGPEMHCRKVGKVVLLRDQVAFQELLVVWSSNTI